MKSESKKVAIFVASVLLGLTFNSCKPCNKDKSNAKADALAPMSSLVALTSSSRHGSGDPLNLASNLDSVLTSEQVAVAQAALAAQRVVDDMHWVADKVWGRVWGRDEYEGNGIYIMATKKGGKDESAARKAHAAAMAMIEVTRIRGMAETAKAWAQAAVTRETQATKIWVTVAKIHAQEADMLAKEAEKWAKVAQEAAAKNAQAMATEPLKK
jgi:hypothetical protein